MNVMNMFEENKPPVIQKPVVDAQPDYAFTPNPYWGQEPVTELPQQTQPAGNQQPVIAPPVTAEPTREQEINDRMAESMRLGYSPLAYLIDKNTPAVDEKKQQRLKLAAGFNALGQGMSTLYGGYMGSKGGPVLAQENTYTPAALDEYKKMVEADKQNAYRSAMAKAQIASDVFKTASGQVSQERLIREGQKNAREERKAQNEFVAGRDDKKMQQDKEQFDASLQLNKDQHKEALAMSHEQLAEQIKSRKATLGYQYYAANLNDKLYRDGLKGQSGGAALGEKFSPNSKVPVQMPDGTVVYIDGVKAWEVLGKVADKTSKDEFGNATDIKNPLIMRMGNNDFTIGEASALISTYGLDLLGVHPAKPVDPLGVGDFSKPMVQPEQPKGTLDLSKYGGKKGFGKK